MNRKVRKDPRRETTPTRSNSNNNSADRITVVTKEIASYCQDEVEYQNWGTNQPDNHTFENCVVINKHNGMWNDQPGYKPRKIICEIQVLTTGSECASTHDIVADVADDKLTASSVLYPGESGPQRARLGMVVDIGGYNSWVPHMITDTHPYIQVEFDNVKRVTGIVTKGSDHFHSWVKKYLVDYSTDGADWTRITENNVELVFVGNTDQYSFVVNTLPTSITAKFVRLRPVEWHQLTATQFGVLGCDDCTKQIENMNENRRTNILAEIKTY
ncbi:hypothetical protein ScPMuIL_001614 [Solemya velum]